MKNQVFLYLFFMLVFVGCQKFESMEDFDALFTHKKCHILSEAEWQKLVQLCNDTWDGFTTRLQARYPQLTEQELRLCLLIRLRFGNVQLAAIFAVSPASISQKKFRLKKHLSDTLQDGLPDETTLDRWVAEF